VDDFHATAPFENSTAHQLCLESQQRLLFIYRRRLIGDRPLSVSLVWDDDSLDPPVTLASLVCHGVQWNLDIALTHGACVRLNVGLIFQIRKRETENYAAHLDAHSFVRQIAQYQSREKMAGTTCRRFVENNAAVASLPCSVISVCLRHLSVLLLSDPTTTRPSPINNRASSRNSSQSDHLMIVAAPQTKICTCYSIC